MIEIQCTSCLTRYRIDPSVLPADRPTFKCSRCGHVFSTDPRRSKRTAPAEVSLKRPKPAPQVKPAAAASSSASQSTSNPDEHNPLARSFAEHEDFKPGENLSFDFAEDFGPASDPIGPPSEPVKEAQWQVGTIEPAAEEALAHGPSEIAEEAPRSPDAAAAALYTAAVAAEACDELPAEAGDVGGKTHSSGFFLLVFFLLLASFTALSVGISNEPAAALRLLSRIPVIADYFAEPAPTVALRELRAEYQRLKDDRPALMISGRADNLGPLPLHTVEVKIDLLDPAHRGIAQKAVYCGNQISPRMVEEMTPRELEFLATAPPLPSFVVNPGQSSSFLAIFVDPPAHMRSFRITVVEARPPDLSGSPRT